MLPQKSAKVPKYIKNLVYTYNANLNAYCILNFDMDDDDEAQWHVYTF